LLFVATGGPVLGVLAMAATSAAWMPYFDGGGLASVLLFVAAGVVVAACCLAPTHATSLIAGYMFGAEIGVVVGFVVVVIAALVGFALWSRLVGGRVLDAIAASPNAQRVHAALLGRGFWRTVWLIALVRLSPLMPFAVSNLMMASLGVRAGAFFCATAIGLLPRSIGVALVGAQLSELDWRAGGSAWATALAIVATLVVILWIARVSGRALRREVGAEEFDA